MKKLLKAFLAILLITSLAATTCFAKVYKSLKTIELGKVSEKYDWPQGIALSGANIYVMDRTRIKQVSKQKIKEIYSLDSLYPAMKPQA